MDTTQTLQNKINDRAKEKLAKEIRDFRLLLSESPIVNKIGKQEKRFKLLQGVEELSEDNRLYFLFNNSFFASIKKDLLEMYIKEETELFLKEIEELKVKVQELDEDITDLIQ